MPSYLEIALRVAGPPHRTGNEQGVAASLPRPVPRRTATQREVSAEENLAACGAFHCAGCYEVAPGVRIHPPKCGENYRIWLERWEFKGKPQ